MSKSWIFSVDIEPLRYTHLFQDSWVICSLKLTQFHKHEWTSITEALPLEAGMGTQQTQHAGAICVQWLK